MPELSGTVTEWLKPNQPLAIWWQRNYPGLRAVSRELVAQVRAVSTTCTSSTTATTNQLLEHEGAAPPIILIYTPGLRYYDYGLLGGAIDYRIL